MSALFTIRPAAERDLPLLTSLFAEDGMALPQRSELLSGTVAVNNDDEAVGFIRVLPIQDADNPAANGNYVYPVIVFVSWRKHGVATALIEYELARYHELKLVACRSSQGFYPRIGFEPLAWSEVANRIAHDCELCPDLPTCHPQPFVRTA
jgi:predicted N-acetyltransferase YhbS